MWRGLYHDHWLLGAHKDTMPRRKWLKPFNFHIFLRRFLSTFLVFALISLSFPIASLSFQDETSEPTYEELMTIFGEEDTSYLTTDDAAWDALLGVMKKWTDFLVYHAYDPSKHPWLFRLRTLGKLLSLRTIAQAGLIFSEGSGEEVDCSFLPPEAEHFDQVSQTLDEAVWDTLEQLILIGMAAAGKKTLTLPAGNGYFVEIIRQSDRTGQGTGDGSGQYPDPIPEPGGGEFLSSQTNRLYVAEWLVKDSEGNTLESSSRLIDLAFWIEPEALTWWDSFIPTPEEICDCKYDFPFGEEEDDGSYFADEYKFRLMAEGGFVICEPNPQWYWFFVTVYTTAYRKGQPVGYGRTITAFPVPEDVWILGNWVEDVGGLRWVISAEVLKRWVLTTSREIKPDTHWQVELRFDDGSVKRVNAEARLEIEPYHPYGVECYCPPYYPPVAISSIFLIGEILPDKSGCPATPYVADGLKVTKWLDFAAETAMGFLLCGDVLVLIKRYWMEQEVGWVEWSSAVLSCIPVLGKIGGLALRGVAGAAKWFLKSRQLRNLAQGSRWLDNARKLGRRAWCWLTRNACFVAGTLVWVLPAGANPKETPPSKAIAKPIEQVRTGDWVLTKEEETGKVGWAPVLRVHKRWVAEGELVVVKAGGEKLKVTKEHPFYVVGRGWEEAGELKSGEKLIGAEGNLVTIEGVEPFKVRGPPHFDKRVAVYNLTVFGTQTYFVGKEKVWVHNQCQIPIGRWPGRVVRGFTNHARDRMQQYGITEERVREVVQNGQRYFDPMSLRDPRYGPWPFHHNRTNVILNDNGDVVTVFPGDPTGRWIPF